MKIFMDIDTQVDFCRPSGYLYIPGAERAIEKGELLVNYAVKNKHPIFGSVDTHPYNHWEFKGSKKLGPKGAPSPGLPPHCIKGTNGWQKIGETIVRKSVYVPSMKIPFMDLCNLEIDHEDAQAWYMEKNDYSLWTNPNAEHILSTLTNDAFYLKKENLDFVVFGVATDYCVMEACLGLVKILDRWSVPLSRRSVALATDACAATSPEAEELALGLIRNSGVVLKMTREVIGNDC